MVNESKLYELQRYTLRAIKKNVLNEAKQSVYRTVTVCLMKDNEALKEQEQRS